MGGYAWVTLATNDSYSLGALVLAHSLRHAGTIHQLAVLVTPGVSTAMREHLAGVFDHVQEVNVLDSNDDANLALLARPDLGITFTKLHCWTLTQYTKCVFLDADTLVLQQCDELFDREEFSAAPDVGWPDCFNSGVFVYRPSVETFKKILDLALTRGSFDGGDQGLLNLYFSDWATQDSSRRLPFIYNMCSMATYSYLPAFKQFGNEARIVHFIGPWKPWLLELNTQTGLVNPMSDNQHLLPLLQQWWSIFLSEVLPKLQATMSVQEPSMGMECEPGQLASPRTDVSEKYELEPTPESNSDSSQFYNSYPTPTYYDPWDDYKPSSDFPECPPNNITQKEEFNESSGADCISLFNFNSKPLSFPYQNHSLSCEGNTLVAENVTEKPRDNEIDEVDSQFDINSDISSESGIHSEVNRSEICDIIDSHEEETVGQDETVPIFTSLANPPEQSQDESSGSILVASQETNTGGMAGALAQLQIGNPRSEQQRALEQHWRRQAWEHGHIDYLGRDSFDKIWAKILDTLSATHIGDTPEPEAAQVAAKPEALVEPQAEAVQPTSAPEAAQPGESAEPTPTPAPPAQVEQPSNPPLPSVQDSAPEPCSPAQPIIPLSPLKSPPIQPSPPKSPPIQPFPPKSPPIQQSPPKSPPIQPSPPKSPPIQQSPPKSPPIQPSPPKSPPIQPSPPKSPPIQQSPPKSPPIQPSPPTSPPIQQTPLKSPPIQQTPPKSPPIQPSPPKSPPLPAPRPKSPVLKTPEAGVSVQATRPLAVGSVTPPVSPPTASGPNQQPQASQSEAEPAPIPPKRRGGPKGGKSAGQKGKK